MNYAKIIDHTLLKTEAQRKDLDKLINEAKKYNFMSVCVSPIWVKYAANLLKNTDVKVCTVIGFPQGATPTPVKVFETQNAIENGANEVDMVISIGLLKDKEYDAVENDIKAVVNVAKGKALTKVIIEACLLTDEEKIMACKLAKKSGADFVKTSTGFSTGGATVHDVQLMRKTVGTDMGVKASGGVRTKEEAQKMIEAGANRIGTSNGISIVEG